MFAFAVLAAGGCTVYDPSLVAVDAAVDAPFDAGRRDASAAACDAGDAGSCLARPPPRPAGADTDGGSELVFALRHMQLNQAGERWRTIGYDLDGLFTVPPDNTTECTPITGSAIQTDGTGGTDNAFGHSITPLLLAAMPTLADDVQSYQDLGIGAILLDVTGWSGLDDDPRVHVAVSQTVYGTPSLADGGVIDAAVPDGGPFLADGGSFVPLPAWDGNDDWWSRDDSYFMSDPTRPRIYDDNAYVAGRTIVVALPDARDIHFSGAAQGVTLRLTDAVLTAHVAPDGRTVDRAILAGRWARDDILDAVQEASVCPGTMNYALLVSLLDGDVDIRSMPGSGGASVHCDALSVGIAFDGVVAHLVGLALQQAPSSYCVDAGAPDAG